MKSAMLAIVAAIACADARAATSAPNNAAIEAVFRQTVEQSPQGVVEMKPGQSCDKPKVQRFKVLRRGLFKKEPGTGRGFFPVTAEVDLRCGTDSAAPVRWNGQLEMQLYENSLNAWTLRW